MFVLLAEIIASIENGNANLKKNVQCARGEKIMTLKNWVESFGGPTQVAANLKVSEQAVRNWCAGVATPRVEHCIALIKLANGKLELEKLVKELSTLGARC